MAQYRKKVTKKGSQLFYRDGERVSKTDIPRTIRKILQDRTKTSDDLQPPYPPTAAEIRQQKQAEAAEAAKTAAAPVKQCIFDGEETDIHRTVNGEMVYICKEHYYSKSLGQLAEQLREVRNGKSISNEKQEDS